MTFRLSIVFHSLVAITQCSCQALQSYTSCIFQVNIALSHNSIVPLGKVNEMKC